MTYAEKTADSEAARTDPKGFYHGMIVRHDGAGAVLCGLPVTFIRNRRLSACDYPQLGGSE